MRQCVFSIWSLNTWKPLVVLLYCSTKVSLIDSLENEILLKKAPKLVFQKQNDRTIPTKTSYLLNKVHSTDDHINVNTIINLTDDFVFFFFSLKIAWLHIFLGVAIMARTPCSILLMKAAVHTASFQAKKFGIKTGGKTVWACVHLININIERSKPIRNDVVAVQN